MKRVVLQWIALLGIASCQQQEPAKQQLAINTRKSVQGFSLTDSLNKYQNADSLFDKEPHRYYVGTANKRPFALVSISDTTTAFYQKKGADWHITDTLQFPPLSIKLDDLNGDGFNDIVMTYNITGIGGNAENVSLLYYSATREFKHNEYFDLPNISYDPKSKLVRAPWWSGSVHPQDKMTYSLVGDSVALKEGVVYTPTESTQGATATVEFYSMQGTHRIVSKKVKGNADRLYKIFEKALWDSEDEF